MDTTAHAPLDAAPTPASSAALMLTPAAVSQVKEIIAQQGFEGFYLTVRVVPAGCSGLGYDLNLVKDAKPGDLTWEQDGVLVATDPMSAKLLHGTEVDYQRTPTAAGFKFLNPNAKSTCGCGTSFSA